MTALSKNLWPALMLLAALWGFIGYIRPQFGEISLLQAEKREYEAAISNANQVRILRSTLLEQYDAIPPEQWERLTRLLPDTVDPIKLTLDLNSVMGLHGMKLDGFSVNETVVEGTSYTPSAAEPGFTSNPTQIGSDDSFNAAAVQNAPRPANRLEKLEVDLNFKTTYPNFTAFLRDLEKSLQVFDIVDVSLGAGGENEAAPGKEKGPTEVRQYNLNVKVRTYFLQ